MHIRSNLTNTDDRPIHEAKISDSERNLIARVKKLISTMDDPSWLLDELNMEVERALEASLAEANRRAWTDERVEMLKRLWNDGLSSSQIAKQLGGVTPNAVTGKVRRLGLSDLAASSKPARTVFKAPQPAPPTRAAPSPLQRIAEPVAADAVPTAVRYVDEAPGMATVLTLGAHMCKWPIGDPALDSFTFCGRRTGEGPYCEEHGQTAYQPAQAKKKTSVIDLARSLRRYI